MSTYTDLHNNIKETINVDYNRRTTNQQVKLLNEQNEYWGTFKGQMEVQGNSVISGAQLQDVVINNAILSGKITGGGLDDLPISQITKDIDQLKVDLDGEREVRSEKDVELTNSITNLKKELKDIQTSANGDTEAVKDELTKKIAETSASIVSTLNETSSYLVKQDDYLSNGISTEVSARISADEEINKVLVKHSDKIDLLFDKCTDLNELALSVDDNSKNRHEDALQKLTEHDEKNEQRFKDMHNEMLSTVESRRHYEICGSTTLTASYPYQLRDYAINTIDTHVQGYVLSSSTGSIVANVEELDDDKITVRFYNNIKPFTHAYYAVQPGQVCENLKSGIAVETGRNDYQIKYEKNDNVVRLIQKDDKYLQIRDRRDGRTIGKVRQVKSVDDYSCQVLSGILDINTSDTTFNTFNKFTSDVISETSPTLTRESEKIVLNDDLSTFSFYTGVHDVKYMNVKDVNTNAAFAIIVEDDVIKDGDVIKSIVVTINEKKVALSEDNDFTSEYTVNGDDTIYTLKFKDNVITNSKTHAKYYFNAIERDFTPESRGQVRILEDNVKDVNDLTSNVEYFVSNTEFTPFNGKSCNCAYDSVNKKWHGTIKNADKPENYINVEVDLKNRYVNINGVIENITLNGTYVIDLTPYVYNTDEAYEEISKSSELDFINGFNQTMEAYQQVFDMYAFRPTSYEHYGDASYAIAHADSSKVEVVFPDRMFPNKSSEFVLRLNVDSIADETVLKFNDEQHLNRTIVVDGKVTDDNELTVKCNEQLTYHVFEVEDGKFIIEDTFNAALSTDMCQKFADVNKLISGLQAISATHQLSISTALSGIDKINEQLSSTLRYQGMISVDNSITSFAELLFNFYDDGDVKANDTRNKPVYPGYFWIVDAISNDYKIEDVKVGKNDRIYINGKDPIAISAVTSARVDVEDVYDSDTVHESQLCGISIILSNYTSDVSNALCEASCVLSTDDMFLSSQISGKVGVGTYDAELGAYDISYTDLSIVTISDDAYYILKNDGKLLSNITYVISSDRVNAHGDRVINVAEPSVDTDAANKKYVDDISVEQDSKLADINAKLTNNTTGIAYLASVSAVNASFNERYDSVLSTIEVCHHKADGECDMLSVEQLIVTDEDVLSATGTKDQYHLTFKYGTLVLVKN